MSTNSLLFTEFEINGMRLKNRLVKSATYEAMGTEDGQITDELIKFNCELASGGVGLIILGYAYVQKSGRCIGFQTSMASDDNIAAFRKLTDAVHAKGGKVAQQIAHAGRQTAAALIGDQQPAAPSAMDPDPIFKTAPRAMTNDEILETIDAFGAAAARTKEAGFDAVQLHGAHGYLLQQFLSPYTNRRTDEWGGSTEKRLKFAQEVIKKVRESVGPDFPVLFKVSVEEGVEGGLTIDESCIIAKGLAEAGIDALEVSGGILVDTIFMMSRGDIPIDQFTMGMDDDTKAATAEFFYSAADAVAMKEAYWEEHAAKIKEAVGDLPVLVVGGMKYPQTMEKIVREKKADLISMGRALIREPSLPNEMANGRLSPSKCAYCNRCLHAIVIGHPLACYNKTL